ncbi:beta-propeller domain-containing protein [Candidatus Woesearchaeota archaeon]|nr:beta-propeller domain-containing protein [Candidatus Woesearchaeota archaeon]
MNKQAWSTVFMISILGLLLLSACTQQKPEVQGSQELKKFANAAEVAAFLKEHGQVYAGGIGIRSMVAEDAVASKAAAAPAAGAEDYSQTNVQVSGVDEADIVKNDGKYIYLVSQDKFIIADAYPAEEAKVVSTIKLAGRPRDLLLNNDRVAIISDVDAIVYTIPEFDFMPRERYTQNTEILVYDISDKANPKLLKNYTMTGSYFESRMIDDHVYLVAKEQAFYSPGPIPLPAVRESGRLIAQPDIYYFDNVEQNYVYHTVASFNIAELDEEMQAKSFLMGYSNTLYVSPSAMYIAYQKNLPYYYSEDYAQERFYAVVVPLLPGDVQAKIQAIKDDASLSTREKGQKISEILEEMYNAMSEGEKQQLIEKIEAAYADYETKQQLERMKTVIHKITIAGGAIEYAAKGEVPGMLLNQFSLDEHESKLRVATTTEIYRQIPVTKVQSDATEGSAGKADAIASTSIIRPMPPMESRFEQYNNVYVLDEGMKIIGKLEDIAPDERIYSTRFMGDRLYMVTFKRIDPLFVIDMSNAEQPEVLGELKIPGYSDYLHPYDESHVIGIGKETKDNEWGGVSVKGVKVALFDVSDVSKPKQIGSVEIGEQGTESEALHEHKAFLFDKKRNLVILPITESKQSRIYDEKLGYYKWQVWQGAYVLHVSPDGVAVKGKISHRDGEEDAVYYGSPYAVRRSLYIGTALYTVSASKIQMNDIESLEKLNELQLPFEKERYYDYWY